MMILFIGSNLFGKSKFSGERLQKACTEYVKSLVGEDAEIAVSQNIKDQEFEESGVIARCNGNTGSFKGTGTVALEFVLENSILRRVEVPVRVKIFREVPVARKNIFRGTVLSAHDLVIERKDITHYSESDLLTAEELFGKKARCNIPKGSMITAASVEKETLIHRGDKVSLVVTSGGVRIRTYGEALQDGAIGNKVRIKRDGTQTILQGMVASDGTVLISTENN